MLDKQMLNMLYSGNKDILLLYYLRIEITILRLYRVMKNISLV